MFQTRHVLTWQIKLSKIWEGVSPLRSPTSTLSGSLNFGILVSLASGVGLHDSVLSTSNGKKACRNVSNTLNEIKVTSLLLGSLYRRYPLLGVL
ncbi:uncharacterized protein LOC108213982 isoform X2 [Daucus carota subsp. sativus]|uniref:uncharacterized protein LOC108213982 isoform X2 n=1 Tax=Daucus carota subsp. sativus TaxID=79200 RepID=UPI003083E5B0